MASSLHLARDFGHRDLSLYRAAGFPSDDSGMPFHRIAVRQRATPRTFIAVYEVEAASQELAIEGAKERFLREYPDRPVEHHSFERDKR